MFLLMKIQPFNNSNHPKALSYINRRQDCVAAHSKFDFQGMLYTSDLVSLLKCLNGISFGRRYIVNYLAFCFDVAQSHIKGAPNEA